MLLCFISHAAVAVGELAKGLIYILQECSQRVGVGIEGGVGVGFSQEGDTSQGSVPVRYTGRGQEAERE